MKHIYTYNQGFNNTTQAAMKIYRGYPRIRNTLSVAIYVRT